MNIFKRIKLFIFSYFQTRKIKKEGEEGFNQKLAEVNLRLLHDPTVADEEIHDRVLQEMEILRQQTITETNSKIKELKEFVKEKTK